MNKHINIFNLLLIFISIIFNIKNISIFSKIGFYIFFHLLTSFILFFLPISIIIIELSLIWPRNGGIYLWIKKAYNKKYALFIIWIYWFQSIMWLPTALIFLSSILIFIMEKLQLPTNNNIFIFNMIIMFWLFTFLNIFKFKSSIIFSIFGSIFGVIIPLLLIIIISIIWVILFENNANINTNNIIKMDNIILFSSVLLGMSGIELISFYMKSINNIKKYLINSLILSSIFIFIIYSLGSISIAVIIPQEKLIISNSIIQAISVFFEKIKINNTIIIIFIILIFIGSCSNINIWISGPSKGLITAINDNIIYKKIKNDNKKKKLIILLIFQAIICTILTIIFSYSVTNIDSLMWIFICLSFQCSSLVYITIFLSFIKIKKKYPNIKRFFNISKLNSYICCIIGIISYLSAFAISFIKPSFVVINNNFYYNILITFIFLIFIYYILNKIIKK